LLLNPIQLKYAALALRPDVRGLDFGEYTLKNGRSSPYFWNAGNLMKTGEGASLSAKIYAEIVMKSIESGDDPDFLMGPAMKGIAIAAITADELAESGIYKRFGFDIKETEGYEVIEWPDILEGRDVHIEDEFVVGEIPTNGRDANDFGSDVGDKLAGKKFDVILAQSYGGIVPAVLIAKHLYDWHSGKNKRCVYNRVTAKDYADLREKLIVGDVKDGDIAIVIKSREEPESPIVGDLREGDRVSLTEDVMTTAKTKIDTWDKLCDFRRKLRPGSIYLGFNRQEITPEGEDPVEVLNDIGFDVYSALEARDVMTTFHRIPLEEGGEPPVSDEMMKRFIEHSAKFGSERT